MLGVVGLTLKCVIVIKGIDSYGSHCQETADEIDVRSNSEVRAGAVLVRRNPHAVPVPRVAEPDGVEAPELPTEPVISPGLPLPKGENNEKKARNKKNKVTCYAFIYCSRCVRPEEGKIMEKKKAKNKAK